MSYYYPTANLDIDLANREREQDEWLYSRPICCRCKERIQEEKAYTFFDCESDDYLICEQCIEAQDTNLQQVWID